MNSVAAQVMAFQRRLRNHPGPLGESSSAAGSPPIPGTPILQQQFGTSLYMAVEIAFGASPLSSSSGYTWTDVTTDVEAAEQVVITIGRANEATDAQPASCTFTLDNRSRAYSIGGQSSNWPNITKNTPVRVILTYLGATYTRFFGYSVGFTPDWDTTGKYAVVHVEAAGASRRFATGTTPVTSTLRHALTNASNLQAYWPCEDGSNATRLSTVSTIPGLQPIYVTSGNLNPAANSGFLCSQAIPTLGSDVWQANVPPYSDTGSGQVRFLLYTPSSSFAAGTNIINIYTTGTVAAMYLVYGATPTTQIRLVCFNQGHGTVLDVTNIFNPAGNYILFSLQWVESGGNITFYLSNLTQGQGGAGVYTQTLNGFTVGSVTSMQVNSLAAMSGAAIGHIFVRSSFDDINTLVNQFNAYNGEYIGDRMHRLCNEQGEFITTYGYDFDNKLGYQKSDTFLNILRDAEAVDMGLLCDGLNPGFSYFTRWAKENAVNQWQLDASLGQVEQPIVPLDDDQLICNYYTASRTNGSFAIYQDLVTDLATTSVGTYDKSGTFGFYTDGQPLIDYAGWQVYMGTIGGYRWPNVIIKLHHKPTLINKWLAAQISNRIDIINLQSVRPQANNAPLALLLEGYTETIDKFTWTVNMNMSPYDAWRLGLLGDNIPTFNGQEYVVRLEQDGSSHVLGGAPDGASTFQVATDGIDVWTTNSNDFPMYCSIGGNEIKVTNITGSKSPFTFTVDPTTVLVPIPPGTPVSMWFPTPLTISEG